MNFLITGHTKGIGKAIYDKFGGKGLSKSTGFDISFNDITPYLKNIDVFVNNAYDLNNFWSQVELIYKAADVKKQFVIGSIASDFALCRSDKALEYTTLKEAVKAASFQLFCQGKDITLIRPGYVDTPAVKDVTCAKIEPEYIADIIGWILKQPYRIKEFALAV